jgi:hypothetical protein
MKDFSFLSIIELLRADGSIIINKKLNFSMGTHTTMVYTELLSRFMYFLEKDNLTDDGYFFNTVDDLKLGTGLGKTAQTNAIKKLEELGFIKTNLRGIPPKRHFEIIADTQLIDEYIKKGAEMIEELKQKQATNAETSQISYSKRFESYATSETNRLSQACNNTNSNNTEFNNTKKNIRVRNGKEHSQLSAFYFENAKDKLKTSNYEKENIIYYLQKYQKVMNHEHPKLKLKQWQKVINNIVIAEDNRTSKNEELLGKLFEQVVDKHFETPYKNCDYNIMHFISGQVMINRYFEVN